MKRILISCAALLSITLLALTIFHPDFNASAEAIEWKLGIDKNKSILESQLHQIAIAPQAAQNSKIAFSTSRDPVDGSEIYIMNPDGSEQTRLTNNNAYDRNPSFSPDGAKIVFSSNRDIGLSNDEIYVMNADGTNQTRLTNNNFQDQNPTFSPDGRKIAFDSNRDGNYEIYIMNADGSGQTRLSNNTVFDIEPTFSPDGTKIAFTRNTANLTEIHIMNIDGSGQTRLTNNNFSDSSPSFSPDGTKIAFTSQRNNNNIDVYIMNINGSGETRLTTDAGYDSEPTFSPDGARIAYTSNRNTLNYDIYAMNTDGTNQTRLTTNPAGDVGAAWGTLGVEPSRITIGDVSLNEGNSGTTAFTFTVSLSPTSTQTVTVNYATANNTAVAPGDYTSVSPTALIFGPGQTSKQISVSVNGDTTVEPNETFFVNLTTPSNAVISDSQGVGNILNDDGCSYAINPTSQNFPASGGSGSVQVTAPSGCACSASSNTVFSNTTPITIPDNGAASPFPSNINVSGLTGMLTDLNVKINNLSHSYPDDVAMLLVSPDGTKKFILQSDSGGGDDLVNLTYTYDDQAANGISDEGPMPVNNGSARPSSVGDDDAMPAPAPATPYSQPPSAGTATLNGTFGGINPNGTWQLFVIDFFEGDAGSIGGGWSLDITTQGGTSNWITITSGQNGSGNGTVSYSIAQNATGQPRTGTMTIAGQTFTVNQSNAQRRTAFDFDGDGRADQAVFRPTNSAWYLLGSTSGFSGVQFGIPTDRIAPADFDGDGRTDIAVFRDGFWYWLNSSNGSFNGIQFGIAGDVPVPADYTGDGRAEIAVYRSGVWYTLNLSNNQFQGVQFGIASDKPVPADFDGDGRTDWAVFRDGVWYHSRSSDNGFHGVQFGIASDQAVVGDYDGDGKADQAVFRSGVWYVLGSAQGFYGIQFGISSDVPVAADYDGDAKTDVAVFRDGNWYLQRSQEGFTGLQFGISIDKPIPAAFVP